MMSSPRPTRRRAVAILFTVLAAVGSASAAVAETRKLAGSGSGIGTMKVLAEAYQQRDPSFKLVIVPNLGGGGGLKALESGAIDIAVISRPVKPDEAARGLIAVEYGRTPFFLATNKKDITSISVARTAEIFAGKITRWPDGTPIRVVLRPKTDIDTQLLGKWSPQLAEALKTAHAREGMVVAPTDQESASQIERLPGSLGASTLALVLSENRKIFALPFDGVMPSVKAISDKSYPHFKSMFIVTKGNRSPAVDKFVRFVLSAEGRAILEQLGHWIPDAVAK
jgi:phosphate transport system substrate-binding protein